MNPLDNLEGLVQRFVEGTFHRFFGKKLHTVALADQLLASLEARHNGHEDDVLPANYRLAVNPTDFLALTRQNGIEGIKLDLINVLTSFANEANCQFDGPLAIAVKQDESVEPGRVEISIPVETVDRGDP